MKQLDITATQSISYCIPTTLRDEHIRINLGKVKGRVEPAAALRSEPIAIVCFGPSLKETWEELKRFKYIMTCSGAHRFLVERGIIPAWHLDLEPREHKVQLLGQPQKETEYLIASTIHPRYLDELKGYNVKLWHIFATEEDAHRILPRGEWTLTGGSSVGLRCLTMARFLGFTDLHVFGMDGSVRQDATHTAAHPNAPQEKHLHETEYDGVKYLTTPSMLFCAKETWKELDQLNDVKATFHGEGLVQHMAKNYVPSPRSTEIAFNKPETISKEYVELNRRLHQDNPAYGMGGSKHRDVIIKLSQELKTTSILDYGAGKQMLAKSLPFPIWSYDPAVPEIAEPPKSADIVVCTDVLEHIEPEKLQFVLDDLRRCVLKVGYFVINTGPAKKQYADGRNTHLIQRGESWWRKRLERYFSIGSMQVTGPSLHVVVGPPKAVEAKAVPAAQIITPLVNGTVECRFYTPNEITAWRAKTLLTKEPVTTRWINSMQPGETLFDVGANVGGYSVLAGTRGVKVWAFEPESENYALLVKNMALNGLAPRAYCLALSDRRELGTLKMSKGGAGGSCHSFGGQSKASLDFESGLKQGCFGVSLDELVDSGQLPHPDHVKIDVDGLEPLVVKGARGVFSNGMKSLLVEVNTNSPEHRAMVDSLCGLGFEFDQSQVDGSIRKDGPFKGVAEYLFRKRAVAPAPAAPVIDPVEDHILHAIANAAVEGAPYPYVYIENVFPADFYAEILAHLPAEYTPIATSRNAKGYPNRFTAAPKDAFWHALKGRLQNGRLRKALCEKLGAKDDPAALTDEVLLIRDLAGYAIGPHTDSPAKVITALFYLPQDESLIQAGTSIYTPKDPAFRCKGGPHYPFDGFDRLRTMAFKPNSVFIFLKTDDSFHGVEPCTGTRNVLLYDIRRHVHA